jgi:hypothetical protein
MFEKMKRLRIQIERERQRQRALAQKHGIGPQPSMDPGASEEPDQVFWRLVAGLGCQLVARGYRLQARGWPQPSPLGGLLVRTGQRLRRRALVVAKSAPCA